MRNTKLLDDNLRQSGATGALPDILYNFLRDFGYSGALPDMLYQYLEDEGYEGTLSEKMDEWDKEGMFSPNMIFTFSGISGMFIDLSDISTMYTDSAGTTQVTSNEDLVGKIEDKANNNDLTQAVPAGRPEYNISGNSVWLENGLLSGTGLQLSSDISVKMVALALQYKTGLETTASGWNTIFTDLSGITLGSPGRCIIENGENNVYTAQTEWRVSVSNGAFGTTLLPLPWSLVFIKKDDDSSFNLNNFCGLNFSMINRTWEGRFAPIAAFSEIPSAGELANLHIWAQSRLGVA